MSSEALCSKETETDADVESVHLLCCNITIVRS